MTRRRERANELIRKEVSDLLRREVKDPRLKGFITITEVSVSPDLKHAKIFVSVMGNEEECQQALGGLAAASGFIRRQLGGRLSLRYTPELVFKLDRSLEHGSHLIELIKEVSSSEILDEAS